MIGSGGLMRKFLKSFLYVLLFGFLVFTGVFSYSEISKTHAVYSDTSYTVNFYGSDNETVIYSVDVPAGKSLQDLQDNNLLKNSDFSQYSNITTNINSSRRIFANNWYVYSDAGTGSTISNSQNGFTFDYVYFSVIYQVNFTSFSSGKTLYLYSKFNDGVYNASLTFPDTLNTYFYFTTLSGSANRVSFAVYTLSSNLTCNLDFRMNTDVYCEYINVGYENLPYFNSDYVEKLYINSGGTVGDNFEWSESKTSSSRFDFSQPITRNTNLYGFNFKGQVFNYNGEIASDYSHLGNYAIKDVEFFDYQGAFLYHIVIDTADIPYTYDYTFLSFDNFGSSSSTSSPVVDSIYFNLSNNSDFPNFFIYSEVPVFSSGGGLDGAIIPEISSDDFSLKFRPNRGVVHIWFSQLQFSPVSRTEFELIPNDDYLVSSRLYDDVDEVVDMSANTNYTFNLATQISPDSDSFFFQQLHYYFFEQDSNYFQIYLAENYSVDFNFYYYASTSNDFVFYTKIVYDSGSTLYFNLNTVFYDYDSFVNFYFYDNYFFIHRPVQRVDNTLVIYNFDYYNLLYSLNGITYTLLDNGNLYNVNYSGSVPNNYFIYLYNEQVSNTIFDEYISLYLKYKNNYLTVGSIYDPYSVSLGFDFNFSYYVQPLVSNNGVYSYTFDKPDYVDMPFSLSPFYIPVLEIAENIMIFLVFYCPLISDIITLLHFDLFFGSLISIFDFIFNSSIGYFFLGCLAFLIYWSLLKLLFPSFLSSSREAGQTFVDSFVSAQEVLDTPYSGKRYKAYKKKSSLGSLYRNQSRTNYKNMGYYKHFAYSGKRNSKIRKRIVSWAKEKYKK